METIMTSERDRVRALNDQLRKHHRGGRIVITRGIQALGAEAILKIGYVEGETIRIDRWTAGGKAERFATLAQEVAQSRPDVIHVVSARLTQHLKAASSEIPVPSHLIQQR